MSLITFYVLCSFHFYYDWFPIVFFTLHSGHIQERRPRRTNGRTGKYVYDLIDIYFLHFIFIYLNFVWFDKMMSRDHVSVFKSNNKQYVNRIIIYFMCLDFLTCENDMEVKFVNRNCIQCICQFCLWNNEIYNC